MSRCLIDLLLYNLYEPKHVQSLHYLSPVYAAQEKFENAALFSLQLDLPSTLIHQKERSFSKTLFKLEEFENASFYVMSVIFAGIRLSNFNFKSRFYGGPKLVVHNCHSKSQSHGTTNFTHGNTISVISRQNKINSRKNTINSRKNTIYSQQNKINSRQNTTNSRHNNIQATISAF